MQISPIYQKQKSSGKLCCGHARIRRRDKTMHRGSRDVEAPLTVICVMLDRKAHCKRRLVSYRQFAGMQLFFAGEMIDPCCLTFRERREDGMQARSLCLTSMCRI